MSSGVPEKEKEKETVFVEYSKGVNGLEKVLLREVRGSSAEVSSLSPILFHFHFYPSLSF